jgi:hypothetical protein
VLLPAPQVADAVIVRSLRAQASLVGLEQLPMH